MHTSFTIWKRCGEFTVPLGNEFIALSGPGWAESHMKSDQIDHIEQQ